MFSLTICALVLQSTLCVTYGAPRRSLPSSLWGGPLATWAAKPGQEFRATPPRLDSGRPRPPRSVPHHFFGPHRGHCQTSQVVSSVVGCAMHMKWPDGIGRGSWDWENPRQESANEKSGIARTDLPYHWVSPCGWKRVGPPEIIVVVEYYLYLYVYIYIYI